MQEAGGMVPFRIQGQRIPFQRVLSMEQAAGGRIERLLDLVDGVVDDHEIGFVAMFETVH